MEFYQDQEKWYSRPFALAPEKQETSAYSCQSEAVYRNSGLLNLAHGSADSKLTGPMLRWRACLAWIDFGHGLNGKCRSKSYASHAGKIVVFGPSYSVGIQGSSKNLTLL